MNDWFYPLFVLRHN